MPFVAIDPSTAETLYTVDALDAAAREILLARVHTQQRRWRELTLAERGGFVASLGTALRRHRESMALALTTEMGKPITAARAEVDKCITLCEQAPALAAHALATETLVADDTAVVTLRYEPLGTVLAIMPWNFPYWQALRFAVPAVLAGNGVLVKPAASVPGSARLLQQCFEEAESSGVVAAAPCAVAFVEHEHIDDLIADPRIVGVTLTGSDRAGRHVAARAGAHLKKVVLELGGSDPFIVLADADVTRAAAVAVSARTVNSGQSCIAAKRFIVVDAVYDLFMEQFIDGMRALRTGDPRDERTQIGPIATKSVWESLSAQVRTSREQGARVLLGGEPEGGAGFFYPPTILTDVPPMSPAANEELFGPVASVFRVADGAAALAAANASTFGLGASVWTQDTAQAETFVHGLDAGMVFVNDMVVSDARLPFGGIKQSGMGRELGPIGFREFTNQKSVRILRLPASPR